MISPSIFPCVSRASLTSSAGASGREMSISRWVMEEKEEGGRGERAVVTRWIGGAAGARRSLRIALPIPGEVS